MLTAVASLVLVTGDAAAQYVTAGDTIRADTYDGTNWTGVLLEVTPRHLLLARLDTTVVDTLHVDAIRNLSVRMDATQFSRAFEGGVVGALGVIATGLVIGAIACHDQPSGFGGCGFGVAVYTVAAVPFGIGIGAALGSKYGDRRKWVRVRVPVGGS